MIADACVGRGWKRRPRGFYLTAEGGRLTTTTLLLPSAAAEWAIHSAVGVCWRCRDVMEGPSLSLGRSEQRRSLIPSRPAGTAIFQRLKVREEREGEGATSMALCLSFVDIRATPRSEKPTGASTNDVYKKIHLLPLCQENL